MKPKIILLVIFLYISFLVYFMLNVLNSNQNHQTTLLSLTFWFIFPIYLAYIIYSLFAFVFYLIMISKYIQIRQNSIHKNFIILNQHLKSPIYSIRSIWKVYNHINKRTNIICYEIHEYSHYCKPILSILIPFYISIQCYVLYIAAITDEISFEQKTFFAIAFFETNLILFYITNQCAKVANYNRQIEVQNQIFYLLNFVKDYYKRSKSCSILKQQLKTESNLQWKRLKSFTFRVIGNYRITSKTFIMV